jgi:hypothetical protein
VLVARAFIPNPLNLPEVNHKNENGLINTEDNLEWCTHSYNIKYSAHKFSKKIECVETGIVYDSIKLARESINAKGHNAMYQAINDWSKTAGGYHWKYYYK